MIMPDSKTAAFIETWVSILIGLVVSWMLTFFAMPFFGVAPNVGQAAGITIMFTIASFIRSYFVRRMFSTLHKKRVLKLLTLRKPQWT